MTVLRRKRTAVHLVGEDRAGAECLRHGEAPLVALLELALHTPVEPAEDDVDRVAREARLLEEPCGEEAVLGERNGRACRGCQAEQVSTLDPR